MLLAGDVGATKTDVAVLASSTDVRVPPARKRFRSADFPSLVALAREFVSELDVSVTHACFAVAGPVQNGRAQLTNLPWNVSAQNLRSELNLQHAWVINDLEAIAHAIPALQPDDVRTLSAGEPQAHGAIAVIAPGTGLGEAFLVWDGAAYRPFPSEGGHADFAPPTPECIELLRYLQARFDHVSYEMVCSGLGIPNLYDFFRDAGRAPESPDVAAELAADDRTPGIVERALRAELRDPLCAATIETFATIIGAEAGNLALKVMATGGVYIAGGIAPRIISLLEAGHLMSAFRRKGRFSEMLSRVPVHVIMVADAALSGAATYGFAKIAGNDRPSAR